MQSENSQSADATARTLRATRIGLFINPLLVIVKLSAGILGNSYALIADATESAMDVLLSLVAWRAARIGAQPPDQDHPYGHGKAEPLGALIISIFLVLVAMGLAVVSVRLIITPHPLPEWFTLPVLAVVIVVKWLLARFIKRVGDSLGSTIVKADASHHFSDVLTSVAAFIGISIARFKGPGYESADDWAALVACMIIAFNGINMIRPALAEIMDALPHSDIEAKVRDVAGKVDGVKALEKCRIRRYGLKWVIDLHVVVDGELSVKRGHQIAHEVKDVLVTSDLGIDDVLVHIEPS